MIKIRTILASFMVFTAFFLAAQDLTGLWQGVSYVKNSTNYYILTLNLQQSGSIITGTGLTKSVTNNNYAIQTVKGTVSDNIFTFADQAIIESVSSGWCMRYGSLTYDPALEKLSGDVQSTNCLIISMELYRLKIFTDTLICNAKNVAIRATGKNLRWYADSTKNMLIYSGDAINPLITKDTTFYVTQTLYNTESPVVPINIRLTNSSNATQNLKICTGQSVMIGDTIYKTSGTYTKKLMARNGCDSTITTQLTVFPAYKSGQSLSICEGESISQGDTVYKTSGTYLKIYKTTNGCDSTITTNLTVSKTKTLNQTLKICSGESITVGDTIYRTTGQYTKRFASLGGCDSLVNTLLTVYPVQKINRTLTICDGETLTVGDTTYKTTGIYIKKLKTTEGCDSTIMTNLIVNSSKSTLQNRTICEGEMVTVGDTAYKTTGKYIKRFKSINGCDSTVTTNVTVNPVKKTYTLCRFNSR